MIIAMLNHHGFLDFITERAMRLLTLRYPQDSVLIVSKDMRFLLNQAGTLVCDSNKLPHRITFVGHSDQLTFGTYDSAVEFADKLTSELIESSKVDARMRNAIKAIDLISCETGLVNQEEDSFAQRVANHLFSQKFFIRVSTFTNLVSPYSYSAKITLLDCPDLYLINGSQNPSVFLFKFFKSEKDLQKHNDLTYKKLFLNQEMGKQRSFYNSILELKSKFVTQQITRDEYEKEVILLSENLLKKTYFELEFKDASIFSEKMLVVLSHLKLMSMFSKKTNIPSEPVECIDAILEKLALHFNKIEVHIKEYEKKQAELVEIVSATDDPRHYFDSTLSCNFVPEQMKVGRRSKESTNTPSIHDKQDVTHFLTKTPSSFYRPPKQLPLLNSSISKTSRFSPV